LEEHFFWKQPSLSTISYCFCVFDPSKEMETTTLDRFTGKFENYDSASDPVVAHLAQEAS
jgi:hypothetical protein